MTSTDTAAQVAELRALLARCAPLLERSVGRVNHPNQGDRIVGFRISEDVGGLSEGLFLIEALAGVAKATPALLDTIDALTARVAELEAREARLRTALEQIERTPAWGYPVEWRTTPAEVRQLARTALGEQHDG